MTEPPLKTYYGSCHYQAVQFKIKSDFPELTTCDCSIRTKKNALMVKVSEASLRIIKGQEVLTAYQFHTKPRHIIFAVSAAYTRSTASA